MKVWLIKKKTIVQFYEANARSKSSLLAWLTIIKYSDWNNLNDIKKTFPSASLIGNDRVIFNVGGNNYRMICQYSFGGRLAKLFVKWIGTHEEYNGLVKQNKQYTINAY